MGMKGSDSHFVIAGDMTCGKYTNTWMTNNNNPDTCVAIKNNPDGLHYKLHSCGEIEIGNLSIVLRRGVKLTIRWC